VTFLFTDVVGSVALWEQAPGAMHEALQRHDDVVRQVVARHHGYVMSTAGDAFHVVFDRAAQAVAAAVEAQRHLAAERWPDAAVIAVRMGIHTGEALERDGDYFGPAVNLTARLMAVAQASQVVISATTKAVVGRDLPADVDIVDLGDHLLRGLQSPQCVYALVGPGLAGALPLVISRTARPGSVPRPANRLIGRHADLRAVIDDVETGARLLTLTGPGGVGKTRLALAVAEALQPRFPDGVWWVELAPVGHDDDVVSTVATAVGIQGDVASSLDQLVVALEGRRVLVGLDNCEHVADGVTEVVQVLIRRCPTVVVLATSRERLSLEDEMVVAVRPLACDHAGAPAVELLAARIGDASDVDDQVPTLLEICRRLDGVPLAIELAAARCRTLGADAVLDRLGSLAVLSDRRRDRRHRTLTDAVAWSYDLLNDRERRLLQRLSIFASGSA
jgi:class 3 adenylate cyclase